MSALRLGLGFQLEDTAWGPLLDTVRLADRLGYDSLWGADHLYASPPELPIFEAWTTLGAWASVTQRATLGLIVGANTLRSPALVAKSVATLDHASAGRAVLGLGAAWYAEEHEAAGIAFGSGFGERLDWLDESVGILRALLAGERVTHDGPHYHTRDLALSPLPVQRRLSILIGGTGEKKTLRTVARYADMWHITGRPNLARLAHLEEVPSAHAEAVGRDTTTIERIISPLVFIRDDPGDARRDFEASLTPGQAADDEFFNEADRRLGPPELVAERLQPFVDAGYRHFVADVYPPFDEETIERLVGEVKPLLKLSSQG
jgi:alkanesulfonate monooxygenase SsuD/methylene tetrahydromethanopterin reductase-like flavin-dependent oxidoreductase (luciferase family)